MPFIEINLGCDDNFLTWDTVADCPAKILLARPMRLRIGRIKKIESQIQRFLHDGFRFLWVQRPRMRIGKRLSKA